MRCMLILVNVNVGPFFRFTSTSRCRFRWSLCEKVVESAKFCFFGMFPVVAFPSTVQLHGCVHFVGGNIELGA